MGSLTSLDAEIGRLAQAMQSYTDAVEPVRGLLRDLAVEQTAPAPHTDPVASALRRLDARLGELADQAADAAGVLRAVQADAEDEIRRDARTDETGPA